MIDPVTGQPAAIRLKGVRKSFGDTVVLRDLDLLIPRGRITFLIGGSGSGKSLTLKHAMGLMLPDAGHIWVGDEEITAMSERKRTRIRSQFGVVFQYGALFDSMTVHENVAFPLREHTRMRRSEVDARVRELLVQVGLEGHENKLPGALSGGMRKRAGLARALAREPRYLLYDEPTAGLDPLLCATMLDLILRTHNARENVTTFVISHSMPAVYRIADKVAMLAQGSVRFTGKPAELSEVDDAMVRAFIDGAMAGVH